MFLLHSSIKTRRELCLLFTLVSTWLILTLSELACSLDQFSDRLSSVTICRFVVRRASSMSLTDTSSPFLPLPEGMVIVSVHAQTNSVVVHITSHLSTALCPVCQQPSERIHGSYVRTVADLPCGGRPVRFKSSGPKFAL